MFSRAASACEILPQFPNWSNDAILDMPHEETWTKFVDRMTSRRRLSEVASASPENGAYDTAKYQPAPRLHLKGWTRLRPASIHSNSTFGQPEPEVTEIRRSRPWGPKTTRGRQAYLTWQAGRLPA